MFVDRSAQPAFETLPARGNWQKGVPEAAEARRRRADQAAQLLFPAIQQVRAQGISSLHAIAAGLNSIGVRTVRGTQWTPTAVRRVLARVARCGGV